jgi:hypothetical protein
MILRIDIDMDKPYKSMVYLDGKMVGGIDKVSAAIDIKSDLFWVDIAGYSMPELRKRPVGSMVCLPRINQSVSGPVLGERLEYTNTAVAKLAEALQGNIRGR